MKKTIVVVFSVFFYCVFGVSIFAQKAEEIRIVGEIVAYDSLSPLLHLTNAAKTQYFVLRVDKIVKGKESEEFILVSHETWEKENKILLRSLNGDNKIKVTLKRQRSCDLSYEKLQNLKLEAIPPRVVGNRVDWISKHETSSNGKMPCYMLTDNRITFLE